MKNIASASIAEVVDRIFDKGVVIDAFLRISLVGIELIAIEVRAVIALVIIMLYEGVDLLSEIAN